MWRPAEKSRRGNTAFDVDVRVHACSNIPHTNGRVYGVFKFRGQRARSSMEAVGKEHSVQWKPWAFALPSVVFEVSPATHVLESQCLRLSIRQEAPRRMTGYLRLGVVVVDLAEYVGGAEVTRRFLLENSRFNCCLHVTIASTQRHGDVLFKRYEVHHPPLLAVLSIHGQAREQQPKHASIIFTCVLSRALF
ncbi:Aste57867_22142 [Aphanomyces stellatus]|uniref:Aste57867_22142 protein n=1 Tax=Aphanomyces stellatus TaxID=120398 RepID=A0A485LKT3_9STRA|nr:hypothetical protein As57867_022073 [Aphanomyces stellatus]VFT98810.1 Aste57867_22142 [Aphanomyces stellatus]